jgi:hypothetical protein
MTTARPWESAAPRPWETAQPLFDRIISIRRPTKPTTVGAIAYQGLQPTKEAQIFSGLPASIQYQPKRERPLGGTPSDASTAPDWRIYVPGGTAATAGQIVERDIVADDLGRRFQIYASWPTQMGFVLGAQMLEA